MVATIGGVLVMWALVSYLHSGDSHSHGSGQEIHEEGIHSEEDHHDEEGIHSEEDHSHEDHE